jgi:hypothetical protein
MPAAPDQHLRTGLDLLAQVDNTAPDDLAARAQLHLLAAIAESLAAHPRDDGTSTTDPADNVTVQPSPPPPPPPPTADGETTEAIERLAGRMQTITDAMAEAYADIKVMSGPLDRWRYISDLARFARDMADDAAARRAATAADIQATEGLSLAKLGDLLGVSRARAGQLVSAAHQEAAPGS